MTSLTPHDIDEILPQTQCNLCGFGGCMPYAKALVNENAPINLCPPGGVETLNVLGRLLQKDPTPFIDEMAQKAKPPLVAIIREAECIGCTKCIPACPVDAILGSAKSMHSVLSTECTGCELCIAPCPVDCIEMVAVPEKNETAKKMKANLARHRFQAKEERKNKSKLPKENPPVKLNSLQEKQNYIAAAIARARSKKA